MSGESSSGSGWDLGRIRGGWERVEEVDERLEEFGGVIVVRRNDFVDLARGFLPERIAEGDPLGSSVSDVHSSTQLDESELLSLRDDVLPSELESKRREKERDGSQLCSRSRVRDGRYEERRITNLSDEIRLLGGEESAGDEAKGGRIGWERGEELDEGLEDLVLRKVSFGSGSEKGSEEVFSRRSSKGGG